ncbi:lactococcin 972 family bacteriocin [Bacillus mycoides]|uniref:lactococcin 972 family bacteriocin n=1 Tax=Bacillus cereus group TaxID=86661 RepID=UPI0024BBFA47|nr:MULTISPECIES: lactococcin 972 family bacteriocin [Bacillus cereus group]WOA63952.1 lactococcin 972 family bacteriocin [Bacillus mycoides]
MKKIVATLAACTCLGLSTISASAASTETSGGINLDPIIQQYKEQASVVGQAKLFAALPSDWKNADGGSFRVLYTGDRHIPEFKHSYKGHGVSATNSNTTRYSEWKGAGDLATTSIMTTRTGNRANWSTDHWKK